MIFNLSIAFAGALGVLSRYHLDVFLVRFITAERVTLIVNIMGSLAAGFVYALAKEKGLLSDQLRVVLITGFCGGFTTFSAYSLQMIFLVQDKNILKLMVYLLFAPALSVLGAFIGYRLALLRL